MVVYEKCDGCPGSGKTARLIEEARAEQSDKKVIVLCFNARLKDRLRGELGKERVMSYHSAGLSYMLRNDSRVFSASFDNYILSKFGIFTQVDDVDNQDSRMTNIMRYVYTRDCHLELEEKKILHDLTRNEKQYGFLACLFAFLDNFEEIIKNYDIIYIDEYQDICPILVDKIIESHKLFKVFGAANQIVYGAFGANISTHLKFHKNAQHHVFLDTSHRVPANALKFANAYNPVATMKAKSNKDSGVLTKVLSFDRLKAIVLKKSVQKKRIFILFNTHKRIRAVSDGFIDLGYYIAPSKLLHSKTYSFIVSLLKGDTVQKSFVDKDFDFKRLKKGAVEEQEKFIKINPMATLHDYNMSDEYIRLNMLREVCISKEALTILNMIFKVKTQKLIVIPNAYIGTPHSLKGEEAEIGFWDTIPPKKGEWEDHMHTIYVGATRMLEESYPMYLEI